MSLFEQSPNGEKKKSLFDNSWKSNDGDEQTERFSSVSIPAVLTLVGGFFSTLVFFSPVFLFIPCCAFLLAVWSLWSIRRSDGMLTGERLAWAGLFLLIVPPVATTVNGMIYRAQLVGQAKSFFRSVFDDVRQGDLVAVRQSMSPYFSRSTELTENAFWKTQMGEDEMHERFHADFLMNPTLLTLITLGERATYSYYKTTSVIAAPSLDTDRVAMVFAVTYSNSEGKKETFFIPVVGVRSHDKEKKRVGWGRDEFGTSALPADFQ